MNVIKWVVMGTLTLIAIILLLYYLDLRTSGGDFSHRVYSSPSGMHIVTMVQRITPSVAGSVKQVIIVEGEYREAQLPEVEYPQAMFPRDATVLLFWDDDSQLTIRANEDPVSNTLTEKDYSVEIVVDRRWVREYMIRHGVRFIAF